MQKITQYLNKVASSGWCPYCQILKISLKWSMLNDYFSYIDRIELASKLDIWNQPNCQNFTRIFGLSLVV